MPSTDDELQRVQSALADAQAALASARAERDAVTRAAELAQGRRHAFLAGLAHDLRNPLAPLTNAIELLRLTDNDPEGRRRTRAIMERQLGHLMRIADELSELARLSDDGAALHRAPFDLAAALHGLADRMTPMLQAQDVALLFAPGLAGLPRLHGDAQRIAEAVGHLVADVARHSERGSTIQVGADVAAGALALHVATAADAAEEAAGSTSPLEDVAVATLGLGVALALQVATLHGGSVSGRRPPGVRRARFTMTLPAAADAAAIPAP